MVMNILEQFKAFLQNENISFIERFGKHSGVNIKMQCNNGIIFISVFYVEDKNSLVCFSDFPVRIPKDKRPKINEYMNALNVQSLITNFVLDGEGFLKTKTSLYSCENEIETETFRRFLYVNFSTLDNQFKRFLLLSEINYSSVSLNQSRLN